MEKSDFIRLKHMLEAAYTCLRFGKGKTRIDFLSDQMLSFAVIRANVVIWLLRLHHKIPQIDS